LLSNGEIDCPICGHDHSLGFPSEEWEIEELKKNIDKILKKV